MVLKYENVEKFDVETIEDGIFLKGLLLDAITAGDALEKAVSELRASVKRLSLENAELRGVVRVKTDLRKALETDCHWDNSAALNNALAMVESLRSALYKCREIALSGGKNGVS